MPHWMAQSYLATKVCGRQSYWRHVAGKEIGETGSGEERG